MHPIIDRNLISIGDPQREIARNFLALVGREFGRVSDDERIGHVGSLALRLVRIHRVPQMLSVHSPATREDNLGILDAELVAVVGCKPVLANDPLAGEVCCLPRRAMRDASPAVVSGVARCTTFDLSADRRASLLYWLKF